MASAPEQALEPIDSRKGWACDEGLRHSVAEQQLVGILGSYCFVWVGLEILHQALLELDVVVATQVSKRELACVLGRHARPNLHLDVRADRA